MQTFTPNIAKRRRILEQVCKKHPTWTLRTGISVFCVLASIVVLAAILSLPIRYPTENNTDAIFGVVMVGAIFAFIPFACFLSNKNLAKYKCSLPFSSYANGTLALKDEALEYAFWRVGPREPAAYSSKRAVYRDEDKFVYTISKDDIRSVSCRDGICTIEGPGHVVFPAWAQEDLTARRQFSQFAFLVAFEEAGAQDAIEAWAGKLLAADTTAHDAVFTQGVAKTLEHVPADLREDIRHASSGRSVVLTFAGGLVLALAVVAFANFQTERELHRIPWYGQVQLDEIREELDSIDILQMDDTPTAVEAITYEEALDAIRADFGAADGAVYYRQLSYYSHADGADLETFAVWTENADDVYIYQYRLEEDGRYSLVRAMRAEALSKQDVEGRHDGMLEP